MKYVIVVCKHEVHHQKDSVLNKSLQKLNVYTVDSFLN